MAEQWQVSTLLSNIFSVSCCYFICTWWWIKKYISIWSMVLHMKTFNLLLCLSFLFSYLMQFLVTINIICNSASIQLHLWNTFLYIVPPPDFFLAAISKLHWDATPNMSFLKGVPTYIYLIIKMGGLLTNQGALEA